MAPLLNILADSKDLSSTFELSSLPDKSAIYKFKNAFINKISPLLEEYFNGLDKNLIIDITRLKLI